MAKKIEKKKALGISAIDPKQEMFVQEYLIDLNATQAAVRAGYSQKTARQIGSQLLANLNIQERLSELYEERRQKVKVESDEVLLELIQIAKSDIVELFQDNGTVKEIKDIPASFRRCISSVEINETFEHEGNTKVWTGYTKKVRLWDKTKALDMLCRHLGLFNDKITATIKVKTIEDLINEKEKEGLNGQ